MSFKSKLSEHRVSAATGAALATVMGVFLLMHPAGAWLMGLSFDVPFQFAPKVMLEDVIVLQMDGEAHREMGQKYGQRWDRRLHAQLLKRLKSDEARLVIFDVFLADPGPPEEDEPFIEAIRQFKNVVLAADPKPRSYPGFEPPPGYNPRDPIPPSGNFLSVIGDQWGIGGVYLDKFDSAVRRHLPEPETRNLSTLPWVAAKLDRAPITRDRAQRSVNRWIRYYSPFGTLPRLSYSDYAKQPPGFFKNKVVFVGGKPATDFIGGDSDAYQTPLTRWTGGFTPGVEIIATTFLNLVRHDWINRISPGFELLVILLAGGLFGGGLALLRPIRGAWTGALSIVAVAACGILVFWVFRVWFDWALVAGVQIPIAWASAAVLHSRTLIHEKEALKQQLETVKSVREVFQRRVPILPSPALGPSPFSTFNQNPTVVDKPALRDFELRERIGEGAYGEVWLGCTLTGACRAIKIVYRRNFSDQRPFEREFEGVRNFEPISRTHPGWVSILHVGKDEAAGFFYYVMEPADDLYLGSAIDPANYTPKTLSKMLIEAPWLPVAECIDIGVALADALAALHKLELVHRDVKPSNIIFVSGAPKLADIGLVAKVQGTKSFVGTEGFIPPERPGTPLADIFSLGRVLYQAATGCEPSRHPELPTSLGERKDACDLMRLMDVINKACANLHQQRYQSAAHLRDDLEKLRNSHRCRAK